MNISFFLKPKVEVSYLTENCPVQKAIDDMLRSGTAPEAENFSSFALTPEGIRIFFQPYQVAPWAAGSQVVDIPLDALADAGPRLSLWGK